MIGCKRTGLSCRMYHCSIFQIFCWMTDLQHRHNCNTQNFSRPQMCQNADFSCLWQDDPGLCLLADITPLAALYMYTLMAALLYTCTHWWQLCKWYKDRKMLWQSYSLLRLCLSLIRLIWPCFILARSAIIHSSSLCRGVLVLCLWSCLVSKYTRLWEGSTTTETALPMLCSCPSYFYISWILIWSNTTS